MTKLHEQIRETLTETLNDSPHDDYYKAFSHHVRQSRHYAGEINKHSTNMGDEGSSLAYHHANRMKKAHDDVAFALDKLMNRQNMYDSIKNRD